MNLFQGQIFEFPSSIEAAFVHEQVLFLRENENLRKWQAGAMPVVTRFPGLNGKDSRQNFIFATGGVWWTDGTRSRFIDVCDTGGSYEEQPIAIDTDTFLGGRFVGYSRDQANDGIRLFSHDLQTGSRITSDEAVFSPSRRTTEGSVYALTWRPYQLYCLNEDLQTRWRRPLELDGAVRFLGDPVYLNRGSVVFGAVHGQRGRRECVLRAFESASGEELWVLRVPGDGGLFCPSGDCLAVGLDSRMVLIDLRSGSVEIDEPTGFEVVPGRLSDHVGVFATEEQVLAWQGDVIRVFSRDGKVRRQEIRIPEPDTPFRLSPCGRTSTLSMERPCFFRGNLFMSLQRYTGLAGLLVLCSRQGTCGEVSFTPRLPFRLSLVSDASGNHGYRLYMNDDNLDELIRHAHLQLLEIVQYLGKDRSQHDHYDPSFNGRLTLAIDASWFEDGAESRVQQMLKDAEWFLEVIAVTAPAFSESTPIRLFLDVAEEAETAPARPEIDPPIHQFLANGDSEDL